MYLKGVDGADLPGLEHAVAGRVLGEELAGDGDHGKTAVLQLTKLYIHTDRCKTNDTIKSLEIVR